MKTFFISDTHFNHNNIIRYCNRPFSSVQDMNEEIIQNWNSRVKKEDIVWFLGDFTLGHDKEVIKNLFMQLNGQIHMIRGNHDKLTKKDYLECGVVFFSDTSVILKNHFILSHEPIEEKTEYFNIFGHVHSSPLYATKTAVAQCVCVERQNYTPITIKDFDDYQDISLGTKAD